MITVGKLMTNNLRVILSGCGGMSRIWLQYLTKRRDVTLVALVDPIKAHATTRAREYAPQVRIFDDIRIALNSCSADLVCDVSVPEAHARTAKIALESGCHVFTEKPITATMEEARINSEIASRQDRHYAVMQNRRHLPYVRAIRDVLIADKLGKLGIVNADFYRDPQFEGDFRREMESPLILDMAIHHFDQMRCMTGTDAISVICHEFNPEWSWYRYGAGATAVFEMTGKVVFTYTGCWCASGALTPWTGSWRLIGERGSLTWDGQKAPILHLRDEDPQQISAAHSKPTEHAGCLDEMFASLIAGHESETSYTDNIKTLAMCHAAISSAQAGSRILI